MKTIYNLIIALIFTASSMLNAQSEISDFTISSPSVDDTNTTSTFVKTNTSLTWTQQNGDASQVNTFTIDSHTGTWDEEDSLGTLTFNISLNGYQAVFTLIGSVTGLSATLKLMDGNSQTEEDILDFTINTITYN